MSGFFRANARYALLLAVACAFGACNYGFRGGGGLPAHVRTMFIAPLENETPQFDLDQQISRALNERLPRSLGLRAAAERNADVILRATVTGYRDVAQNYRTGAPGTVEVLQHQVTVTMTVRLIDVTKNEILFEQTGVSGTGEYRPDTQNDLVARTKAIELLIQRIIDGAQSQW